jgi:hypothetical protein
VSQSEEKSRSATEAQQEASFHGGSLRESHRSRFGVWRVMLAMAA